MTLNQKVSHDFDVPDAIIYKDLRIEVVGVPVILESQLPHWHNNTDSCLGIIRSVTYYIEPLHIAVALQGAQGTKETLPLFMELPVSDD